MPTIPEGLLANLPPEILEQQKQAAEERRRTVDVMDGGYAELMSTQAATYGQRILDGFARANTNKVKVVNFDDRGIGDEACKKTEAWLKERGVTFAYEPSFWYDSDGNKMPGRQLVAIKA